MRRRVPLKMEELEGRQLLSGCAVEYLFKDGELTINGSNSADEILVHMQGSMETDRAMVAVTIGHGLMAATEIFASVNALYVNGNDGNDRIKISGTNLFHFWRWTAVSGGNGNDILRVVNFDGSVFVGGGDGNDLIDASRAFGKFTLIGPFSIRQLWGGTGNDRIIGSPHNDQLHGDAGSDMLIAGSGNDMLNGGSGKNILMGGVGNDVFEVTALNGYYPGAGGGEDVGGFDTIIGGLGYDGIALIFNSSMIPYDFGLSAIKGVEYIKKIDYAGWF